MIFPLVLNLNPCVILPPHLKNNNLFFTSFHITIIFLPTMDYPQRISFKFYFSLYVIHFILHAFNVFFLFLFLHLTLFP